MIDVNDIHRVISKFYDKAMTDILIGYHFRIIEDFQSHIPRIVGFWELQLNGQITDKSHLPFDLMNKHKALKMNRGELGRWIILFQETLDNDQSISLENKKLWLKKIHFFEDKMKERLF